MHSSLTALDRTEKGLHTVETPYSLGGASAVLDSEERSKLNLGRQGTANIISESGLYLLVLKSRKPEAKAFQKWGTAEVLPSIRKTGEYVAPPGVTPPGPAWEPLRGTSQIPRDRHPVGKTTHRTRPQRHT